MLVVQSWALTFSTTSTYWWMLLNCQLLDNVTKLRIQGLATIDSSPSPTCQPHALDADFSALIREFPSISRVKIYDLPMKHHTTHHIETKGPPVSARARRLAPERLKIARCEIEHMLQLVTPPVPGPLPYIWCQRKLVETGDHVETTVFSNFTLHQIAIPFPTSMTSRQ